MSSVVTFYSFKGGVGRSMSLANVAVLLAQRGSNVLVVDWDLEAPGLHRYFGVRLPENADERGLIHLLHAGMTSASGDARAVDWRSYAQTVSLHTEGSVDIIPAGALDPEYATHLEQLDWAEFFAKREGGAFIESLRDEWGATYDHTLIDSRTGYTDSGGICTVQMPDVLVGVFSASGQSVSGLRGAITRAEEGRQQLAYDRTPLTVLPLPSRHDGRVEVKESRLWLDLFTREMTPYYESWLPQGTPFRRVVERMKVPHVPLYSFGERLPVLEGESVTDPEGISYALDTVARLIEADFRDADELLFGTTIDEPDTRKGTEVERFTQRVRELTTSALEERQQRMRVFLGSLGLLVPPLVLALVFTLSQETGLFANVVVLLLGTALGGTIGFALTFVRSLRAERRKVEAMLLNLDLADARTESPTARLRVYEDALAEIRKLEDHPVEAADQSSTPKDF